MDIVPTSSLFLLGETSNTQFYSEKNSFEEIFYKNCNLLEAFRINVNVCFISKYTCIKKQETVKCFYGILNSIIGVIIYENNDNIKGISMTRKDKDK